MTTRRVLLPEKPFDLFLVFLCLGGQVKPNKSVDCGRDTS